MEDITQKGASPFIDFQLSGTLQEPRPVAGDAMPGWLTDEEFDVLADSIVGHFDSLAGDLQAEAEKDDDTAIGEVLEWFVKEGIKLMPDSALQYLRSLVDDQIRINASIVEVDKGEQVKATGRSVVMYDIY